MMAPAAAGMGRSRDSHGRIESSVRVVRVRFSTEGEVGRAPGQAIYAGPGQLMALRYSLYGLDLEPQHSVVVPPSGVLQSVLTSLCAVPGAAAPASLAFLGVVEVVHGLLGGLLRLRLGHLDSQRSKVQQVAY